MSQTPIPDREFDFVLILTGVKEFTTSVEDALFEAGCDAATLSMQYGILCVEFLQFSLATPPCLHIRHGASMRTCRYRSAFRPGKRPTTPSKGWDV